MSPLEILTKGDGVGLVGGPFQGDARRLRRIIREDLIVERIALESYRELARYVGDDDPTTRRMLECVLTTSKSHVDDLLALLANHSPRPAR
jgi:bacterioferritin (cytochrome b1)